MTICYSLLFSLLIILSITHWTYSASLGTPLLNRRYQMLSIPIEESTVEPILSRRRPFLPMSDRLRRRAAAADDEDEVEVPFYEKAAEISMVTSTENSVTTEVSTQSNENFETVTDSPIVSDNNVTIVNQTESPSIITTESMATSETIIQDEDHANITVMENVNLQTTSESQVDPTTVENSVEPIVFNSTVQSISTEAEETQTSVTETPVITTVSVQNEETASNNVTVPTEDLSTITAEPTDDSIVANTTVAAEELSTISTVTENETSAEALTTIVSATGNHSLIEELSTDEIPVIVVTEVSVENVTSILDENATMTEEVSTNFFDLSTSHIDLSTDNSTEMETNETESSEVTFAPVVTTRAVPICDHACQCSRKCPYGFEIVDDQCKCDPPCKNYNCFRNDTCVIAKNGKPVCEPSNNSTIHDRPKRCYQPRDPGYHDENIQYHSRWYYHPDQDECHLFVYRGLGGNENNFVSLNDCRLECITCAPAPDRGPCLGYMKMWYYNHQTSRCSTFEYSGCKGNDNKFLREKDCIDTCVSRILNL